MDDIMAIARKHHIPVIEDCAHNPGGSYLDIKSGNWGDIGVFSFQQQKNISTLGEGGMVTTNNREYFDKILSYRSLCCRIYGESDKYLSIDEVKYPMQNEYWKLFFDDIGFNFRMTDIQACVGIEQLKKLDALNQRRIEIAAYLREGLSGIRGHKAGECPVAEEAFGKFVSLPIHPRLTITGLDYMIECIQRISVQSK